VQVDLSVIEGKYLHDILDQPRALENTLASLQENPSLRELTARLRKGNFTTLVLTGMGSSFHALHPLQLKLIEHGITAGNREPKKALRPKAGRSFIMH
jgi:fructoselysine-6-P-deglycase FrlB-like protein